MIFLPSECLLPKMCCHSNRVSILSPMQYRHWKSPTLKRKLMSSRCFYSLVIIEMMRSSMLLYRIFLCTSSVFASTDTRQHIPLTPTLLQPPSLPLPGHRVTLFPLTTSAHKSLKNPTVSHIGNKTLIAVEQNTQANVITTHATTKPCEKI